MSIETFSKFRKTHEIMIIAHTGASREAPGNTLLAFEKAVDSGAEMIEFDIHKTADNQIVVIHDRTTQSTSEVNIDVRTSTLEKVKSVHLSHDLRIPTLNEVFAQFKGKLYFQIEIKQRGIAPYVLSLIDQFDVYDQCVVSSFWHDELQYFKKSKTPILLASLEPTIIHVPLQYLLRSWMVRNTINLGLDGFHPKYTLVTPKLVALAHSRNIFVNTWTADNPKDWKYLLECGVDGIMTNCPRELYQFLESR